MGTPERIVYQFPISHYCEKTRWNLDAKGLSYAVKDLIPGLHMASTWRAARMRTVPILVDRGTAVGDSTSIARYLDRAYPDHPLLPEGEAERAKALEIEAYFGEKVGPRLRQWVYGRLMQAGRGRAMKVLFAAYPQPIRRAGELCAPLLERAIARQYKLTPDRVDAAQQRIAEGFERIERETGGDPSRYLVGDRLSIADITAASVLGALIGHARSPWSDLSGMPESVHALRDELSSRPGWAWVRERYERDRQPRA